MLLLAMPLAAQTHAKIQEGGDAAMFAAADEAASFAQKHKLSYIVGRDEDGGPWSAEFVKGYTVAMDPAAPNPVTNEIAKGIDWKASGYNSLKEAVAAAEKDVKKYKKGFQRVSPDFVPGRMSPDMIPTEKAKPNV
jgi:hypothetical protein